MSDKKGVSITVELDEWERFTDKYNASKKIREFIREVNGSSGEIKDRIQKVNEDIEEKKNEINRLQSEISDLQSKRQMLKNEMERQEEQSDEQQRFIRIFEKKFESSDWECPDDIKSYWVNELDKDRKELWEMAKTEVTQ